MLKEVAVLGAGHVGHACSADLSLSGYKVNLYELPEFEENLEPILERGGIEITENWEGRTGFAKLNVVTSDIKEAIKGVDLIQIIVPAFGHGRMAEVCAPHLEDGQILIFCPGGGTLIFAKTMREMGIKKKILLGEMNLPPYSARRKGPAQVSVHVHFRNRYLLLAALPVKNTDKLVDILKEIFPAVVPATNVLETILCQVNFVGHPAASLLNVGRIEYLGPFRLWGEGVTPSVAKVIEAVDKERLAVMMALDMEHLESYPELQSRVGLCPPAKTVYEAINTKYSKPLGPTDVKKHRFISEDVPYGLVTCASIGNLVGVDTPVIKSLITMFSVMNEIDYWREGRTTEKLGISGLSVDELKRYVTEGNL